MFVSQEEKRPSKGWRVRLRDARYRWRFQRRRGLMAVRNRFRRRHGELGYLILPIGGSLPERSGPPRTFIERQLPLPPQPLSIQTLNFTLRRIIEADNVPGVVILLHPLNAGLASLQSLRGAIMRLRDAGKRVVIYTSYLTVSSFYIGSAADMLVVPPSAEFQVMGLQAEVRYFKDALEQVGVKMDVVAVSPYKSAGSNLSESTMTPQERAQLDWLLDENFDMLISEMAAGRGLTQAEMRQWVDQAPFGAEQALAADLVDNLAYDDQLAELIAARWPPPQPKKKRRFRRDKAEGEPSKAKPPRAKLIKLRQARKRMMRQVHPRTDKYIGVINVEGTIMMDTAPPLLPFASPVSTAAQNALVPLLRQAGKDDEMAALILHVNSPGGDALASDLIWREVERIRPKKPIVVYMNNVAASGGYYIAAGGSTIVAQRGTITGSIGVVITRPAVSGVLDKLNINAVTLKRGANASLYRGSEPWTVDETELVRQRLIAIYDQFKQVVAKGRDLPLEDLDLICEGRVWTGRQALEHRLVDEQGDFLAAIARAKQLAEISAETDVPIRDMVSRAASYVLPDANSVAQPSVGFHGYVQTVQTLFNKTLLGQISGRPMMLMPFDLRLW